MPTVSSLRELAVDRIIGSEEVLVRFVSAISAVADDINGNVFYTRQRIKSVDSILNKVRIKRRENNREEYSIDEIGDIAGIRFVTLYDDQLSYVFESIIRTLYAFSKDVKNSPFIDFLSNDFHSESSHATPLFKKSINGSPVKEIKIYRRTNVAADFYNRLVDQDWPIGLEKSVTKELAATLNPIDQRADSYSSVHILTDALSYNTGVLKSIPMEIQIRTVAEDVWCEVSHGNKYKAKDLFYWSRESSSNFENLKNTANTLKTHIDGVNEQIRNLRLQKKQIDDNLIQYFSDKSVDMCGSTLVAIAKSVLGANSDNHELDVLCNFLTEKYRTFAHPLNRRELKTAISVVEKIIEKIDEIACQVFDSDGNLNEKILTDEAAAIRWCAHENSKFIFQLELVRLKILVNTYAKNGNIVFDGPELMRNVEAFEAEHANSIMKFDDFLEYRKINPRSVINYIKFQIYAFISSENTNDGFAYLSSAYELLRYDKTIPYNSILRVLIKRDYARYIFESNQREEETLNELNFNLSSRIENLKHNFNQAFVIASDVFMHHESLSKTDEIQNDISQQKMEEEEYLTKELLSLTYISSARYVNHSILISQSDIKQETIYSCINYCLENNIRYRNSEFNFLFTKLVQDYTIKNRPNAQGQISKVNEHMNSTAVAVLKSRSVSVRVRELAKTVLSK